MPKGKGTYGGKRGRPRSTKPKPKVKRKKRATAPRTDASVGAEGSGQMAIGGARMGAQKVVR